MEKTIALESEKKANQSKSCIPWQECLMICEHLLNGIIGLIKINMDHFDDIDFVA